MTCCQLLPTRTEVNVIEAAAAGATNAIAMVANIAANLIAFIALLQFVNATLTWFGQRVGIQQLTFQASELHHLLSRCKKCW